MANSSNINNNDVPALGTHSWGSIHFGGRTHHLPETRWGKAQAVLNGGLCDAVPESQFAAQASLKGFYDPSQGFEDAPAGTEHLLTTGANGRTSKVKLPLGWRGNSGTFSADLELFCVSGSLRIGSITLKPYCYCYIPAGKACGEFEAEEDTQLLWFVNGVVKKVDSVDAAGVPSWDAGLQDREDVCYDNYIAVADATTMKWTMPNSTQFGTVAVKKWLRKDSGGGGTWLLHICPHAGILPEVQHYNEEAYCLSGNLTIADMFYEKDWFSYVPAFALVAEHTTQDAGCTFLIRVDRDLSSPSAVATFCEGGEDVDRIYKRPKLN